MKEVCDVADKGLELAPRWKKPQFYLAKAIANHKLGNVDKAIDLLNAGLDVASETFPTIDDYYKGVSKSTRELEEILSRLKDEQAAQESTKQTDKTNDDPANPTPVQVD